MHAYPSTLVRTVALVGHGGAGKTTLAEALALACGAVSRAGRVEDGTTVADADPEEHARGCSLASSLLALEWGGHKLNVLDTPGTADFVGEALAALAVADAAVFVVSGVDGVEVQTELLWRAAAEAGLPRLVFVNKLDRERSGFEAVLAQLRDVFGAGIAPLELPIGAESGFVGVVDLLSDTAITYAGGRPTTGPVPDDMAVREHGVHDALVEGIVVADDDLMERYLDGEVPSVERLEKTLAAGVARGTVFPVLCGSATRGIGVDRLATLLCEIGPSPLDRPAAAAEPHPLVADPHGPTVVEVWKTVADRHVGRISLLRVRSGTVTPDTVLVDGRTGAEVRLHAPFTLRGHLQVPVEGLACGDLGAVAKLGDVATGDTLAAKGTAVRLARPRLPEPNHAVGIRPRTSGDDDKLMTALHRLVDDDPTLAVRRDDETGQTLLVGLGETHVAVATERLMRRSGVAVDVEAVRVAYRETVVTAAEAEGRYKKQTGGHGQFGVATLQVEPLEPGAGFEFVDRVVGGVIPRQYIPAVQKGVEEAMAAGGPHGFPVVDVRVTCTDGRSHPVDSSEMSFKMAGAMAFREAVERAGTVVLEPVAAVEVEVDDALLGDVMGDLNARRGRVQGSRPGRPGTTVVDACVPVAELARYSVELRALTGGRASFTARPDHHERLPAHLAARLAPTAPTGTNGAHGH